MIDKLHDLSLYIYSFINNKNNTLHLGNSSLSICKSHQPNQKKQDQNYKQSEPADKVLFPLYEYITCHANSHSFTMYQLGIGQRTCDFVNISSFKNDGRVYMRFSVLAPKRDDEKIYLSHSLSHLLQINVVKIFSEIITLSPYTYLHQEKCNQILMFITIARI